MSLYFLVPIMDQCVQNQKNKLSWEKFILLLQCCSERYILELISQIKNIFEIHSIKSLLSDGFVSSVGSTCDYGVTLVEDVFFSNSKSRKLTERLSNDYIYDNYQNIIEDFFSNKKSSSVLGKIFDFERQLFWWICSFRAYFKGLDVIKFLVDMPNSELKDEIVLFFSKKKTVSEIPLLLEDIFAKGDHNSVEKGIFNLKINFANNMIEQCEMFSVSFLLFRVYQYMCELDFSSVTKLASSSEIDTIIGYDKESALMV